jgi:ATP-dependent helicase/nuclease subunit A
MTVLDPLHAADPARNATVHASAGTGKTWLLVTRIVRLLLAGAPAESMLAVTFTRKAAAEMQQRVMERLRVLAGATPAVLDTTLQQYGVHPDDHMHARAGRLYEELLFNPYSLRATTFHAFCQELLQRFPLEAGVTPGFAISEATGILEQSAWDALVAQTAINPDSPVATALDRLVTGCDGLGSTRTALLSFLAHRSDWWAFTQGEHDPLRFATRRLTTLLEVDVHTDPLDGYPNATQREDLLAFAELLGRNTTKTNMAYAGILAQALAAPLEPAAFLAAIVPVFFKADGEPRERKAAATQRKRLGEAGETRFLALHEQCVSTLLELRERQARCNTLHNTLAWHMAGTALLAHYQRIKQEQRVLDFADLEWLACELLNRSEHASWVQYKLDSRIDHLLVDEFQDTNPTQWRLLLPLLQELAAGRSERGRSVFLVGDRKQSIYSFRRANPALLEEASAWLCEHLQAERYPLDASRRSAAAIIDCVNAVFGNPPLPEQLAGFNPHSTHLADMFGHVELLPLTGVDEAPDDPGGQTGLRNPLRTPRPDPVDRRHHEEGTAIAARMQALVGDATLINVADGIRRLHYGDIMILLRQRTHATAYEQALRDAGIPYLSASRGMLLDNLEVRDLEALLRLLVSPYDNLALAQVLRSPVFGLESEQLLPLAGHLAGTWYEHLARLAAQDESPYNRVFDMLSRWRDLAGQIPVHDLLDRIFHEAELLPRYQAAFPEALAARVHASLTRFIELALEVDNGRYPSLPRFLDQLERLRQSQQDQPDESPPAGADGNRVRIMTIHAAKGLEAPVVFLADMATAPRDRKAHAALVDWPGDQERPSQFLLTPRRTGLDTASRVLLEQQARERQREDANLLYVAITRARQYLYISASAPTRGNDTGWYGLLSDALAGWRKNADGNPCHTTGKPATDATIATSARITPAVDPRLSRGISVTPRLQQIAPSHADPAVVPEPGDADGRERGIAIHRMLDHLSSSPGMKPPTPPPQLASCLGREAGDPDLCAWWQEALQTCQHPDLSMLFDPRYYVGARNEVPLQYFREDQLVYGIIDRLVMRDDAVLIIDYKTHRRAAPDTLAELAGIYREQMQLYSSGVARLWPGLAVRPYLLFTTCNALVEMEAPTPGAAPPASGSRSS